MSSGPPVYGAGPGENSQAHLVGRRLWCPGCEDADVVQECGYDASTKLPWVQMGCGARLLVRKSILTMKEGFTTTEVECALLPAERSWPENLTWRTLRLRYADAQPQ